MSLAADRDVLLPSISAEIREHGLHEGVVDGIATRSGLSVSAVLGLFPDADHLLIAVMGPEGFEQRGMFEIVDNCRHQESVSDALSLLLQGMSGISRRDHRILRAYRQRAPYNDRLMWATRSAMQLVQDSVTDLFKRHQPLLTQEEGQTAYLLFAAISVLSNDIILNNPQHDPSALHERQRRALRLLLCGLSQIESLRTEPARGAFLDQATLAVVSDFLLGVAFLRAHHGRPFRSIAGDDVDGAQRLCMRLLMAGADRLQPTWNENGNGTESINAHGSAL